VTLKMRPAKRGSRPVMPSVVFIFSWSPLEATQNGTASRSSASSMPGIARSSVLNAANVRACSSRRKFCGGARPSIPSMTRRQCGSE